MNVLYCASCILSVHIYEEVKELEILVTILNVLLSIIIVVVAANTCN